MVRCFWLFTDRHRVGTFVVPTPLCAYVMYRSRILLYYPWRAQLWGVPSGHRPGASTNNGR